MSHLQVVYQNYCELQLSSNLLAPLLGTKDSDLTVSTEKLLKIIRGYRLVRPVLNLTLDSVQHKKKVLNNL